MIRFRLGASDRAASRPRRRGGSLPLVVARLSCATAQEREPPERSPEPTGRGTSRVEPSALDRPARVLERELAAARVDGVDELVSESAARRGLGVRDLPGGRSSGA